VLFFFAGTVNGADARADVQAGDSSGPQVRLIAIKTDIVKRYRYLVPALPLPPFTAWNRWLDQHVDAVHCVLEWRTENGEWYYGELRSTVSGRDKKGVRVGWGEFPGTGHDAYGIYITSGRVPRDGTDPRGVPIEVALDEVIACDYRHIEAAIRQYGARDFGRNPGCAGDGSVNRKLGGPPFKPAQNSNTMVSYILKRCGAARQSPDFAVGWDTIPSFPYSTDKDTFEYDIRP